MNTEMEDPGSNSGSTIATTFVFIKWIQGLGDSATGSFVWSLSKMLGLWWVREQTLGFFFFGFLVYFV